MKGEMVIYNGRPVPKEGFRVFIYSFDNAIKLVNTWDEYQECIRSGIWFATRKQVPDKKQFKKRENQ